MYTAIRTSGSAVTTGASRLVPQCANHPQWPGQLHDVPGTPCRNYLPKPPEPDASDDTVRRIPLGDGQFAIVDAADYDWLNQYHWRLTNGYPARRDRGKTIYMHSEIMKPPKGMMVDHVNHYKLDNRRTNLRVCTRQQNTHNNSKHVDSSSRFKGVGYRRERGKWFAKIWFEGARIWLGYFTDEVVAAHVYDRKAVELFGTFAHLNFPGEWPPERRQQVYAAAQPLRDTLMAKAKAEKGKGKKAKGKSTRARTKTPARKARRHPMPEVKRPRKKSPQKTRRAPRPRKPRGPRSRRQP